MLINTTQKNAKKLHDDLTRNPPKYAVGAKVGPPEPHQGYIPRTDQFIANHFTVLIADQMYKFVEEGLDVQEVLKSQAKAIQSQTASLESLVLEVKGMGEGIIGIGEGVKELVKRSMAPDSTRP